MQGNSTVMMEENNSFTTPHSPVGNNELVIGDEQVGGNFYETLKFALGNNNIVNHSNPFIDQPDSAVVNQRGNFFPPLKSEEESFEKIGEDSGYEPEITDRVNAMEEEQLDSFRGEVLTHEMEMNIGNKYIKLTGTEQDSENKKEKKTQLIIQAEEVI